MMVIIILLCSYEKPCGARRCCYGADVNIIGWANGAPEMPDYMGVWLEGIYCLATDRNAVRKNLILSLGLFAVGVWLTRSLSDIDLMAPQFGVWPERRIEPLCCTRMF